MRVGLSYPGTAGENDKIEERGSEVRNEVDGRHVVK
jgi:hypothetical protein